MCGIAGLYHVPSNSVSVQAVLSAMRHRGPDGQGHVIIGDTCLLHTRLSVIDLSTLADQPYIFGSLAMVYNGEIYNYREIRDELIAEGYTFESQSDSEVIIKAFHRWGENCVDRMIGMFAFAIHNRETDELVAFRDRLGVKPFYYSWDGTRFIFGSELKFFSLMPLKRDIDPESLYAYFRFGYVPGHRSIFSSVRKLEPGHWLKVGGKKLQIARYWNLPPALNIVKDETAWMEELESLMVSAFRYRMVSDVPVGLFLSGGIDSSLLAAILQKHEGGIRSFTIGFTDPRFDESAQAEQTARILGLKHTARILDVKEGREVLGSFYGIYDEPFADTSGIPASIVARLARDHGVKVVLSADGGDELFGGYPHYLRAGRLLSRVNRIPGFLRKSIAEITSLFSPELRQKMWSGNLGHRISAGEALLRSKGTLQFFEEVIANQTEEEITRLIRPSSPLSLAGPEKGADPLQLMMNWDLQHYLPDDLLVKIDRATMHHGVESREPYLDHRLVEFSARLPLSYKIRGNLQKYILRQILRKWLPSYDFSQPKRGFSIPVFSWFSGELDSLFAEHLAPDRLKEIPCLEGGEVLKELARYQHFKKNGKEYNVEKMWRILSFVLWWESYGKR